MDLSDIRIQNLIPTMIMIATNRKLSHDRVRDLVVSNLSQFALHPDEKEPLTNTIVAHLLSKLPQISEPPLTVSKTAGHEDAAPHAFSARDRDALNRVPFRFVGLANTVVPAPGQARQPWNFLPIAGGVSGEIRCVWEFETPLLVGQLDEGIARPFQLGEPGSFALPGATLRGLIRAHLEIVTRGRLTKVSARPTARFQRRDHPSVTDIRDRDRDYRGLPLHQPRLDSSGEFVDGDMVDTLFGYVYEPDDVGLRADHSIKPSALARKGRVLFGFATLDPGTPAEESTEVRSLMVAPQATYGPFYLAGPIKDWIAETSHEPNLAVQTRLAGRKRYRPRYTRPPGRDQGWQDISERLDTQKIVGLSKDGIPKRASDEDPTVSRLRFLRPTQGPTLRFHQTIRLHNLSPAEVGALLFAMTHGSDPAKRFRHMVGRGKPFGAGQAVIKSLSLALSGHDARGDKLIVQPDPSWEWEKPWLAPGSQSMTPYLREFAKYMRTTSDNCKNWPWKADHSGCLPDIAEWLGASDPSKTPSVVPKAISDTLSYEKARLYPSLKQYGKIRDIVRSSNQDHDTEKNVPDRLLAAPHTEGNFGWISKI